VSDADNEAITLGNSELLLDGVWVDVCRDHRPIHRSRVSDGMHHLPHLATSGVGVEETGEVMKQYLWTCDCCGHKLYLEAGSATPADWVLGMCGYDHLCPKCERAMMAMLKTREGSNA